MGPGAGWRAVGVRAAVLVIIGVLVAWVLLWSPWLKVRRVQVVGVERTQAEKVRLIADQFLGEPLLKVDTALLQADVARLPPVERVDVTRDWPDRLTVVVTMRTPVVILRNAQGALEVVDGSGNAYAVTDSAVKGVPNGTLAHPDQDRERRAAASVMGALDAGQRARVTSVQVASEVDVKFVIDQVTVRWGGADEGRQKAIVMAALLQQKGIRSINVSAPDSPVAS